MLEYEPSICIYVIHIENYPQYEQSKYGIFNQLHNSFHQVTRLSRINIHASLNAWYSLGTRGVKYFT